MTSTDLILAYLDVWNEREAVARRTLMESVLTGDSRYADPDYPGLHGHAELSAAIGRAQQDFGELRFTLGEVIGAHHDRALFTWRLGTLATGYDVVEFAEGRISSVIGFFG